MTEQDIIDLWNANGINKDTYRDLVLTMESLQDKHANMLKELDVDSINPKVFWRAAETHFSTDPVCNTLGKKANNIATVLGDIANSNWANHMIPTFNGLLGFLECAIHNVVDRMDDNPRILEIGAGYGSFYKHFVEERNQKQPDFIEYQGVDLISRFPAVEEVEGDDGCLSEGQVTKFYLKNFNIVYSCNVFHHLSKKQQTKYVKQISEILPHTGYLAIANVNGGQSFHYGQIIELFNLPEFVNLLKEHNLHMQFLSQSFIRHSGLPVYTLLAQKIKPTV